MRKVLVIGPFTSRLATSEMIGYRLETALIERVEGMESAALGWRVETAETSLAAAETVREVVVMATLTAVVVSYTKYQKGADE